MSRKYCSNIIIKQEANRPYLLPEYHRQLIDASERRIIFASFDIGLRYLINIEVCILIFSVLKSNHMNRPDKTPLQ